VGFARAFFHDLAQLTSDQGAHPLLAAHAGRIQMLECEDPGIFADIDTPSDLSGLEDDFSIRIDTPGMKTVKL
jgi:molybdenum cofactor cytidylyltransferase